MTDELVDRLKQAGRPEAAQRLQQNEITRRLKAAGLDHVADELEDDPLPEAAPPQSQAEREARKMADALTALNENDWRDGGTALDS